MEGLSDYMVLALALSGVLGLVGALSHPSFVREADMAVGVLCIFALASPIITLMGVIPSLPELPDSSYVEAAGDISEVGEDAWLRGISLYLVSEYSLKSEDVSVEAEGFDLQTMRAEGVRVTLSGASALGDLRAIRADVAENFISEGGKCEVVIGFDG